MGTSDGIGLAMIPAARAAKSLRFKLGSPRNRQSSFVLAEPSMASAFETTARFRGSISTVAAPSINLHKPHTSPSSHPHQALHILTVPATHSRPHGPTAPRPYNKTR